jgi:hypothetical protein
VERTQALAIATVVRACGLHCLGHADKKIRRGKTPGGDVATAKIR